MDFFKPGALHLLEQLCVMVVAARTIGQIVEENPMDEDAAKAYTSYAQRCAMHCQKLRLSIQSALRTEAGELNEEEPSEAGRETSAVVKFDRWRVNDLERALERIGAKVPLDPHGQGYRDMSGALDQCEALALNGRLRHGNQPVLTWCASNAVVTKDAAGNRKLDRSRATGRIDGLVAAVMAVAAMSGAPEPTVPQYQMFFLDAR